MSRAAWGTAKAYLLLHTEDPASGAQTSQPLQDLPPAHIPAAAEELNPLSQR